MQKMSSPLKWLVITPTLGISPYLSKTLASITQLPGTVEHIIICPYDVVSNVSQLASKSRVIAEPMIGAGGMYSAINIGIRCAETDFDFFCYLNDDDLFLPGVKLLSNKILNSESINYGRTIMINKSDEVLYEASVLPFANLTRLFFQHKITTFMQPSMVIPRLVLEKTGFFDESYRYCGDLEYILRAAASNITFCYINIPLSAFRIHGQQLSSHESEMTKESVKAYHHHGLDDENLFGKYILKIIYGILNIPSYIVRLARTGKFTSNSIFYRKK